MHAEIVAIGTEMLLGELVDTNSATIAKKLQSIGLPLHYTSTVGDNLDRIVEVLQRGLARSDVLITTGGLGPTVDDMTREGMARATGRSLIYDEDLVKQIEERFHRWGRTMSENNKQQAYRPAGSTVIENPVGTAPSFIVDTGDRVAICLPGVPREMEYLMDTAVLPYLRQRFNLTGIIKSRELKVSGTGESLVDEQVGDLERLANPTVGLNAKSGIIIIRITATAQNEAEADQLIATVENTARERLGDMIFGTDSDSLESVLLAQLSRQGETLAIVESGTGGRLGGKLAEADQGRGIFKGGQVRSLTDLSDLEAVARQAAITSQADWGLACAIAKTNQSTIVHVGTWHAKTATQWNRGFGSHPALASEWASNMALDTLRKQAAAL
jgi:competence/damage-inducible protein CinA-like protein